jgi:pimeloyl-ACP methyl ester carboxylesterase
MGKVPVTNEIAHRTIEHAGCAIHYFTSGDTRKETVVFIHPAYGDHRCFDRQIDCFSSEYHVITLDLPGHGLSHVASGVKIDRSATIIDEILMAENKTTSHIVGVSIGALIGQYFALQYPHKVLSMTALGGYDIQSEQTEIAREQRKEIFGAVMKIIFSMDAFRRYAAAVSCADKTEQLHFYRSARSFTRRSLVVMSGFGNIIRQRDKKAIRSYPLMIMVGDSDMEIARRAAENWHNCEPDSLFTVVRDAGHCANMDNSQEFNEAVIGFLRSASSVDAVAH